MKNFKIAAQKIAEALEGLEEVSFTDQVKEAAAKVKEDMMGRKFISKVHKEMAGYTLEEFKAKLVEAHLAGELRITRCDLPYMYDKDLVAESSTKHLVAEYHFIVV